MIIKRLAVFSSVGFLATGIHAFALWMLLSLGYSLWISNALGFLCAFLVSFVLQQRFTFRDRLRGKALSSRAGSIIFIANLLLSLMLAAAQTPLYFLLPLMPAVINFLMYYWLSGMPQFRRDRVPGL